MASDLDLSELHPDFDRHGKAGISRSEIYVHDDAGAMTRSIQGRAWGCMETLQQAVPLGRPATALPVKVNPASSRGTCIYRGAP